MSQPATLPPRARTSAGAPKILVEPVTPVIGAEIGGVDLSQPLDPAAHFRWRPGSLVVWDNQAVAHAGPIDYAHFDQPRVVRRITVAGDLPQGPDGFRSQPLEGELFNVLG